MSFSCENEQEKVVELLVDTELSWLSLMTYHSGVSLASWNLMTCFNLVLGRSMNKKTSPPYARVAAMTSIKINTIETPIKLLFITLETLLKLTLNTPDTPLKLTLNTPETNFKQP